MTEGLRDLMRCVLTPGLGPVLLDRALAAFGSPAAVLAASERQLASCRGIGSAKAGAIHKGLRTSEALADAELRLADKLGATIIPRSSATYPEVLRSIPGAPPILYVLGELDPHLMGVGIVGSRGCTPYGVEQAERFGLGLADSGVCVVSGGARGIDAAAHRGALRARGKTIAVLGCGLANRYPPEHGALFDAIVEGGGAIISELPLKTQPVARNFPARNRIVSGLSLGVVVIEASAGSGALITARYAAEEHGREVMVVPGRVDSPASEGSHTLLKEGAAALVTHVRDVLEIVEPAAHHMRSGTHARRYAQPHLADAAHSSLGAATAIAEPVVKQAVKVQDPDQQRLLEALMEPGTLDQVMERSGLDAGIVRSSLTMLELQGLVKRQGDTLTRR